jgi:hypothetical protein
MCSLSEGSKFKNNENLHKKELQFYFRLFKNNVGFYFTWLEQGAPFGAPTGGLVMFVKRNQPCVRN